MGRIYLLHLCKLNRMKRALLKGLRILLNFEYQPRRVPEQQSSIKKVLFAFSCFILVAHNAKTSISDKSMSRPCLPKDRIADHSLSILTSFALTPKVTEYLRPLTNL